MTLNVRKRHFKLVFPWKKSRNDTENYDKNEDHIFVIHCLNVDNDNVQTLGNFSIGIANGHL